VQRFGLVIFTASALACTVPFAMGSWFGIERRTLLLGSWTPRKRVRWALAG